MKTLTDDANDKVKLGLTSKVAHADRQAELQRQADRFSTAELREALGVLGQARADLDQNVNPRLALDVALLRLPGPSPIPANRSASDV